MPNNQQHKKIPDEHMSQIAKKNIKNQRSDTEHEDIHATCNKHATRHATTYQHKSK